MAKTKTKATKTSLTSPSGPIDSESFAAFLNAQANIKLEHAVAKQIGWGLCPGPCMPMHIRWWLSD